MQDILTLVKAQLAIDLNCAPEDFGKDELVFCEAKENPGRRPFSRNESHIDMLTMGTGGVVSATPDILPYVKEQLSGKTRDEAFNMHFVSGMGLYYVPGNPERMELLPYVDGFSFELIERNEIPNLYPLEGFKNALNRDVNHPRPDVLVTLAKSGNEIIAMAGASADCENLWQIGIDVQPEYRRYGLAAVLTNRLAIEILNRGKVPYYGTAPGNIPSQRVALRSGFVPCWTQLYRGRFDGVLTSPTG